jgi:heptosyltransferase-2
MNHDGRPLRPQRLLVVLPNWVGDLVLATPALRAIRTQFPEAYIAALVKPPFREILSGGDWADEILVWPVGRTRPHKRRGFLGLAQELREKQFDTAVLLTNSFRSALLARLAGVRRRVGYDRDGRGLLLTDKLLPDKSNGKYVPVPMVRYYNAIARYLGARDLPTCLELYTTREEEAAAQTLLDRHGIRNGRPIIVINPGASFGTAKCWLPERFAEVADGLVDEFDAAVFISCGPKDRDVARAVSSSMRHEAIVLDQPVLSLGPLKALVRRSSLLVTNDTGPRHFAIAFGVPVVTLFGSTDPRWTQTDYALERQVMVKVHCGPCMKRVCPTDHRCMTRVTAPMVLEAARALLADRAGTAKLR